MIQVKLLGNPQALNSKLSETWTDLAQATPLFLMAYLVHKKTWVSRDSLRYLFWPDTPEKKSLQNLRGLIFRAKKLPYGEYLEVEKTRLRWVLATDIEAFGNAIKSKEWHKAVALFDGPFLSDFSSTIDSYNDWLHAERRVVESSYHSALIQYADQLEQTSQFEAASELLETIVLSEQLAEDILQQYLRNTYLAGNSKHALTIYQSFKERLKLELDLEPLESTQALVQSIRDSGTVTLQDNQTIIEQQQTAIPINVLKPPQLIGRNHQLAEIKDAQESVILLAGEAGTGKSRLMTSLAPNALKLICQEGLDKVPYFPITSCIRQLLDQEALPESLGQYKEDLARLIPEVAPEITPSPVDAELGRARLFEALSLYFEHKCGSDSDYQLVIDDLQWSDEATLEFLVYLARRKSLKLLCAYRVHEATNALSKTINSLVSSKLGYVVRLEPLSYEDVIALVGSLTGTNEGPPLFSQWLHKMTAGNPMFMLETIKSLFEADKLRLEDNLWVTDVDASTEDYSELGIPDAVSDIIQRRIERLSENTQRIMAIAAVVNRDFSTDLLSHVSGLSHYAVINSLEEAENFGLIYDTTFTHDLFRQSVYDNLSVPRKRTLHNQIASLEEAIQPMEAALRAEHWLLSEKPAKAAKAWLSAGKDLMERGLLEDALEVLNLAKKNSFGTELYDKAILLLCETTFQQANYKLSHQYCIELLDSSLKDVKAAALDLKARILLKDGQVEAAETYITQGLVLANQLDNPALRLQLVITHHLIIFELGHAEAAVAMLSPEVESLRNQGISFDLARVLTNLASNHNHLGDYAYALELHLEALEIAKNFGAKHIEVDIAQNLVYTYIELGEPEKGITIGEKALKLGNYEMTDGLRANLAAAYIKLEQFHDAIHHYEAMTQSTELNIRFVAWGRLAGLYSWTAQSEKSLTAIDEAFGIYKDVESHFGRARAVVSLLNYGNQKQLTTYKNEITEVQAYQLPPYLQKELDDALVNFHSSVKSS